MPNTEPLYAISDDAASDLEALDRHVAMAKEACRAAIELLAADLRATRDEGGRCYSAVLEAIDDLAGDRRKAISLRLEEADIAIEDAESLT